MKPRMHGAELQKAHQLALGLPVRETWGEQ